MEIPFLAQLQGKLKSLLYFKPAQYDLKSSGDDFLKERLNPTRARAGTAPVKPVGQKFQVFKAGPRDIGWNKGWKVCFFSN